MRGIKIPPQDFALKMQGGLCTRGDLFARHYGTWKWKCGEKQGSPGNTYHMT